jgi:hypothetical protein
LKIRALQSTSGQLTAHPTEGGGTQDQRGSAIRGLSGASLLNSPGHGDAGFLGQNDVGSMGFLPGAKHGGEWLTDGSQWQLPSSEDGRW